MPSNSAREKIARAKRHLLAARILISSLPSRYWTREKTAEELDAISEALNSTQRKIKAVGTGDEQKTKPGH